ncbi:MAG: hypothetical protein ACK5UP_14590 [Bacteroidota bacterium]|jgi:hypothetical protein|nr:hypothetical protein [Cytophagales bacterium]MCE2957577.1 hypothetical protein [Flammeovirgaceae bacterium]MCZ8068793.1 hypothetical protein [Cytophagales bacterium]
MEKMSSTIRQALKTFLGFIGLMLLIAAGVFFVLLVLYFRNNSIADSNQLNISKIRKAMTSGEVVVVLGVPAIKSRSMDGDSIYVYQAHFYSSGDFMVVFDSKSKVKNVLVPEGSKSPF